MEWKVMTFNLRVNVEADGENAWPARYTAVARTILHHRADIVCIQEGLFSMLQDLEPLLAEYAWVGEGRRGGREDEFCAIWYNKNKIQVEAYGNFALSETPDRLGTLGWNAACPRMCTWARMKSAEGKKLAVFNTHLDHVSEEAQIKGMELIGSEMDQLRKQTGSPVALTGDFNVGPGHAVVLGLEQAGYVNGYSAMPAGTSEVGSTFHDFKGGEAGEPIDYIFVCPDLAVRRIEVDRAEDEGRYPSDHYPVCASLTMER